MPLFRPIITSCKLLANAELGHLDEQEVGVEFCHKGRGALNELTNINLLSSKLRHESKIIFFVKFNPSFLSGANQENRHIHQHHSPR